MEHFSTLFKHDCLLKPWGDWGECSHSCGGGRKVRLRQIALHPAGGGKACPGIMSKQRRQTALCGGTSCSAMKMHIRQTCAHLAPAACQRHEQCIYIWKKKAW